MLLYAEKSWTPVLLVPASGEVSSSSGSESKVYFSGGSVTGIYTGCPRRKGPNFRRVFLRSNYNDITQNTYIQSSVVTEILAREA